MLQGSGLGSQMLPSCLLASAPTTLWLSQQCLHMLQGSSHCHMGSYLQQPRVQYVRGLGNLM